MAQTVEYYQQKLRQAQTDLNFARSTGDPNSIRVFTARFLAAQNDLETAQQAADGTVPANSVNPTVSPAARQVESSIAEEYGIPANFAETAQPLPPSFDEQLAAFLDEPEPPTQSDTSPEPPTEDPEVITQTTSRRARAQAARVRDREPENPTEDSEVNEQQNNRDRAQAQRIENADAENLDPVVSPAAQQVDSTVSRRAQAQINRFDRQVTSDPTSFESLTEAELRQQTASTKAALDSLDALPTQERLRVQTQIDALENQLDLLDQETARRRVRGSLEDQVASGKRAPTPVNDTQAKEQQIVFDDADDETLPRENPEETAQANNAALQQLREQSIVKQSRENDAPGDWRVKLRLASESENFYNSPDADVLLPLKATDGIVFPYTPTIQIMYAAEYNSYHPTHSNYQHYFYKGSKVGEVVLTATFTAQDTEEANYLLAVIHFFKSASKMFYGQDKERGSPPPLLFMSGLGDYQFNEAPCVISQFNYVLPNDVDYIRAQVDKIPPGTLQTDLRNKGTGNPSLSSKLIRITSSNLFGAVDPPAFNSTGSVNLSSDTASYVPTKIEMTITLMPVQNRLQVSEGFSLKEYANGSLVKGGFW